MKLTPVMEKYVLHWGEMGTRWGVNRSIAQIHALLYLSDRPLTDAERHMAEVEYLDDLLSGLDATGIGGGDPRQRAQRVLRHYSDVAHRFRQAMGDRLMDRARARAQEKGVRSMQTFLEDGDPASVILRLAKDRRVDMIFLGSRGLGDAKSLLMGSVSHKVAHLAECTFVSVK